MYSILEEMMLQRQLDPIIGYDVNLFQHNYLMDQQCWKCGVELSRYDQDCGCDRARIPPNSQSSLALVSSRSSLSFNPYSYGDNGITDSMRYMYDGGLVNQTSAERICAISSCSSIKMIEIARPVNKSPMTITLGENGERQKYTRFREKKFFCDSCDQSFTLLANVAQHIYTYHHPGGTPSKVQMRKPGSTPIKKFQCSQCSKLFPTLERAQRHKKRYHMDFIPLQSKKIHSCEECKKVFATGSQLEHHISSVHRNEPFKCDLCPLKYSSKSSLTRHIQAIHKKKTFKCTYPDCPHLGFICPKALTAHIRTHTGERPFKCLHCDKTFIRHNDLRTHEKSQHVLSTHQCRKCSEIFLKRVLRDKHEEKCTAVVVKAELRWGDAPEEEEPCQNSAEPAIPSPAICPDRPPLAKLEPNFDSFLASNGQPKKPKLPSMKGILTRKERLEKESQRKKRENGDEEGKSSSKDDGLKNKLSPSTELLRLLFEES